MAEIFAPDVSLEFLRDGAGGKVADRLVEKIRYMIVMGKLPAGYMFPNENEFCAWLNVGRSSLREAYQILEATGFITRTKRGTYVNDGEEIARRVPFNIAVEMSEMNDLLEFRIVIEAQVAGLAARRASDENLAALHETVEEMKRSIKDVPRLAYADSMFHLGMARASHNRLLGNVMRTAIDPFTASVTHIFREDEAIRHRAVAFHEKILDAVRRRDEAEARQVMRKHIDDVQYASHGLPGAPEK